jgi:radical SAM protein with 4Fe4S-binding SPASM domain
MIDLSEHLIKGDKWLFDLLVSKKQEIYPNDYKLDILYTEDQFDNATSPGKSLSKLQEYLAHIDIPNFFVTVHTNKNIDKDINDLKNLFAPDSPNINIQYINGTFKAHFKKTDSLCLYPWFHVYINSQGNVGTCCDFNENFPLGNIHDSSLLDIANNENMRLVRTQMLAGQRPATCSSCWNKEDNNISSPRLVVNKKWAKYQSLVDLTEEDGSLSNFTLKFLDFRATNICNLKCRMCGGKFSSRIAQEEADLYNNDKFVNLTIAPDKISDTLNFVESNIQELDAVYFAGGEPLIMSEHYQILDLLIKHNRTDIELAYNTNLTVLKYKNLNVVDYWKKFKNVNVGASIDLIGPQATYVRSGSDYNEIETNYNIIKDYVNFKITSIVHILNIFNLPKLQKHWINNRNLSANLLSFRPLVYPENLSLQILPADYKLIAEETILNHITWLSTIPNSTHLVIGWNDVLQYMNAEDRSHLLRDFFRLNDDKDQYRKEKFDEVFPEYKKLRDYV